MRVLSLFSGIGGLDLGLERAGMRVVRQIEKDPYCRAVLRKHWPDVRIDEDVMTAEYVEGEADVVCGGFPCQDVSNAGLRAGITAERSGLYRELVRAIRVVRPLYAIVENVAALLGRGMGTVLGDLAEIGYDAEWDCIPACAVGARHIRDRVFIVANNQNADDEIMSMASRFDWPASFQPRGLCRMVRGTRKDRWQPEPEPRLVRVADRIPNRIHRLRALGNVVVPQVAEVVGRAVMDADKAMRKESVR